MKFNEFTPRRETTAMDRIGDAVSETAPLLIVGAVAMAATYAGAKFDHAINTEMIDALAKNFHWYNVFTTEHAMAGLVEKYGAVPPAIVGAIAAVLMRIRLTYGR